MTKSSPSRGFTLIELLVVIAIIAVLMGLLFPVVTGVKDQANKARAKNDVTQIVTAIKAYYTEYSKYPDVANAAQNGKDSSITSAAGATAAQAQVDLFNTLRASGTATINGVDMNPRRIVFIEPPLAKDPTAPKGGIIPTGGTGIVGSWVDPWGVPYQVAMDTNYDNGIASADLQNFYQDNGFTTSPITTGAIAWSLGKDKKLGNNGDGKYNSGNSDDVISWQ